MSTGSTLQKVGRAIDESASRLRRTGDQVGHHVPYGASIFFAVLGYFAAFSVLVFIVDSIGFVLGGSLPVFVQVLVYILPVGFAVAGWNYGAVTPGENP